MAARLPGHMPFAMPTPPPCWGSRTAPPPVAGPPLKPRSAEDKGGRGGMGSDLDACIYDNVLAYIYIYMHIHISCWGSRAPPPPLAGPPLKPHTAEDKGGWWYGGAESM